MEPTPPAQPIAPERPTPPPKSLEIENKMRASLLKSFLPEDLLDFSQYKILKDKTVVVVRSLVLNSLHAGKDLAVFIA